MYLRRLFLNNFGHFYQKEIELKSGINIIYGKNEAGKSTIHSFIKGMLFGIERLRGRAAASKEDTYTRYLPWEYPGAYHGSLDLVLGEKEIRLKRSFHANDKSFTMIELTTGRDINSEIGDISELIPGLTESTFKNTISIEQLKAHTDGELAAQVRNYMANLSISKSNEVSVDQAVKILNDQRKRVQLSLKTNELQMLEQAIEEGLVKEEHMEELVYQLKDLDREWKEYNQLWEKIRLEQKDGWSKIEQYPAIVEKYRTYKEYERQCGLIEQEIRSIQRKASQVIVTKEMVHSLKEDILEVERYQEELNNPIVYPVMRDDVAEEIETKRGKAGIISILVGVGLFVLFYLGFGSDNIVLTTGLSLLGMSLTYFIAIAFHKRASSHPNDEGDVYEADEDNIKECDVEEDEAEEYELVEGYEMEPYGEELSSNIRTILVRHQVNTLEDLYELLENLTEKFYEEQHEGSRIQTLEARKNEIEDYRDILYDGIMTYMDQFIQADELSEGAMLRLYEEVSSKKTTFTERVESCKKELELRNVKIERLKWEISNLETNEIELTQNKEKLESIQQQMQQENQELDAIVLALETIQELSVDIHDSFGRQLNDRVSEIIGEITGDKYSNLKIDEKLNMKIEWKGNYVPLERLSAGTIDQVYLSMRLAIADLLLEGEQVPLLFDDSFALYDDDRIKTVLNVVAKRKQVIIFTCHNREQKLLEEMNLPFHSIDLSTI